MEHTGVITRIEPYSIEWFKHRLGTFTASEIHRLMTEPRSKKDQEAGNLSDGANTYILEKVHEKLTGKIKQGISNFATEWGIENEPLAIKWYAKLTGNKLSGPYLVFHETLEGFACTPDNFVNEDGLVEVKCPATGSNHLKHCFITTDEYFKKEHPEYFWQCMSQMNITGRKWCDFVSFDPRVPGNLGMFIYRLNYNEVDGALLEEKVNIARDHFNGYYESFSK